MIERPKERDRERELRIEGENEREREREREREMILMIKSILPLNYGFFSKCINCCMYQN